jgi:hypothetical protein
MTQAPAPTRAFPLEARWLTMKHPEYHAGLVDADRLPI